jgi:hypothetical protein
MDNSMLDAKCKQEFLCYKYDEYKNNVKEYARSILPNVKFVELKERSCLSTLLKECMKDVTTPLLDSYKII